MKNKYLFSVVGLLSILGLTGCDDGGADRKPEAKKEQAAKDKSVAEAQKASFSGTQQGANGENVPTQVAKEIQQMAEHPAEGTETVETKKEEVKAKPSEESHENEAGAAEHSAEDGEAPSESPDEAAKETQSKETQASDAVQEMAAESQEDITATNLEENTPDATEAPQESGTEQTDNVNETEPAATANMDD